jgi:malate dehydrogenase
LKLKGIGNLSLYDLNPATPGIALDVSHVDIAGRVQGYTGNDISKALDGADVVVVPAGVPRKPGMTRDDLFNTNAGIVAGIVRDFAKYSPKASLLIISNPVNSTVPIAAEVLKKAGVYNPRKLFGVTTLDVIRANNIVSDHQKWDVAKTNVTVIGGHAGITILPLLSQLKGGNFNQKDKETLTHRIAFAGDDVVAAKGGSGSATLSMAFAGALFAEKVLEGLEGKKATLCSYVASNVTKVPFFASQVDVGKDGIEKIHGIGQIDDFEKQKLDALIPELEASIKKGVDFATKFNAK